MATSFPVVPVVTASLMGLVFGFALEKARVFEPYVIEDQMKFRSFIMLKMFLAATATGLLSLGAMHVIPATRSIAKGLMDDYKAYEDRRGFTITAIGAAILGAGMTISGACPGMVLAQVGGGVSNALITVLGALLGCLAWSYIDDALMSSSLWTHAKVPKNWRTLDDHYKSPFEKIAIPFGAVMFVMVLILEALVPWGSEHAIGGTGNSGAWLSHYSWNPIVSGIFVGLLQIPCVIVLSDTLRGASAYSTIVAAIFSYTAPSVVARSEHLKYSLDPDGWWQVAYIFAAMAGARISATLSSSVGTAAGISMIRALSGGFLILFGARIAGGCTSGHGLSGMATLFTSSFVAVAAMFAGGMFTALFI